MQEHTLALCYQVTIRIGEEIADNGYIYGHSQCQELKCDNGERESKVAFA